mgnify:CR=1 FL=1
MYDLMSEYYELKTEVSILMGAAMGAADADLSDPMALKTLTTVKKLMDFSDKMFEAQIDMMKKIDKIYEKLTTKE